MIAMMIIRGELMGAHDDRNIFHPGFTSPRKIERGGITRCSSLLVADTSRVRALSTTVTHDAPTCTRVHAYGYARRGGCVCISDDAEQQRASKCVPPASASESTRADLHFGENVAPTLE